MGSLLGFLRLLKHLLVSEGKRVSARVQFVVSHWWHWARGWQLRIGNKGSKKKDKEV